MEFLNNIRTFFENIGIAQTIFWLVVIVFGAWGTLSGILPVLIRLGRGLAKRQIAIFAKGDRLQSLKNLLLDSKLFKAKNIKEITSVGDMGRAEGVTVFLVFWEDWKDDINQILKAKTDSTALIVYAPVELGDIPPKQMRQIGERRNVTVTNFRGRLLNDIVVSMITTSYD
jgi:hypothetical protein